MMGGGEDNFLSRMKKGAEAEKSVVGTVKGEEPEKKDSKEKPKPEKKESVQKPQKSENKSRRAIFGKVKTINLAEKQTEVTTSLQVRSSDHDVLKNAQINTKISHPELVALIVKAINEEDLTQEMFDSLEEDPFKLKVVRCKMDDHEIIRKISFSFENVTMPDVFAVMMKKIKLKY